MYRIIVKGKCPYIKYVRQGRIKNGSNFCIWYVCRVFTCFDSTGIKKNTQRVSVLILKTIRRIKNRKGWYKMDNNNSTKVATAIEEEWVPAQCDGVDYPLYQVSDQGRVKRVEYSVTYNRGGHLVSATMKEKLVQPKDNGNGYLQVALRDTDGNKHYVMLSRLVLGSFEPLYNPELTDVDHIDSDRLNDRLDNLRRLSHRDNLVQPHRMKQIRKPVRVISADHTVQYLFDSVSQAAEFIGVQQGRLSHVLHHGNHINGFSVYFKD